MAPTFRAPRGPQLTFANWQIEAAYRMVQNNLEPRSPRIRRTMRLH